MTSKFVPQDKPAEQPAPQCLSKAETYLQLRLQLLELHGLIKDCPAVGQSEFQKRADRLGELIKSLQELDAKSAAVPTEDVRVIQIRANMEELRTKLELKEIELQQAAEELQCSKAQTQEQAKVLFCADSG